MNLDTVMHLGHPLAPLQTCMMDTESPRHSPGDIFSDTMSLIKEKVIQQKAIAFTSAQWYASWSETLLARNQFFCYSGI